VELIVGQEDVVAALDSWQARTARRVGADAPAAYRVIKCGGKRPRPKASKRKDRPPDAREPDEGSR